MLSSIELKSNVRVRQEAKYRRCIGAVWPLIFLFCSKPQKRLDLRSEHCIQAAVEEEVLIKAMKEVRTGHEALHTALQARSEL